MSEAFDPYHKWLGIPPADQPPNHYRLLGVTLFESDPDVIAHAAEQRIVHVRAFQIGKHSDESQRILREISAARDSASPGLVTDATLLMSELATGISVGLKDKAKQRLEKR